MRAFLIGLVVLVFLVVGGVAAWGFSHEWFGLTVNEAKIENDTEGARDKVQGLGKQIKDKAEETVDKVKEKTGATSSGVKTATGTVKKVEAADNRFLMTIADSTELTVYTNPSSTLRLNDQQVGLEDLRIGDEVKVDYDFKGRKDLATSVTANRK
jgi:Cu/Ag efflux protein CusF